MPGPFPGMDPYLENVSHWRGVHSNFITLLTFHLNECLPEPFVARSEGRCYVLPQQQLIYPDALLIRAPSEDSLPYVSGGLQTTILSTTETAPLVFEFSTQEVEETFVEIISVDDERVVTIVELLSPSNKTPESTGREQYRDKQRLIRGSASHLLEIDLLREGQHTVAVPHSVLAQRRFDYLISLRRAGEARERFEVWPLTVREKLPTIRVPLTEGWPDVLADLQLVLDRVYDQGRWRQQLHYSQPPEPPLSAEDTAWADGLLKGKGLRVAS